MSEIRFEPLPEQPRRRGRLQHGDSPEIAAALRGRPREWAVIKTYTAKQRTTASGYVSRMRHGVVRAYAPPGAFEATIRKVGDEIRVYARYVGRTPGGKS